MGGADDASRLAIVPILHGAVSIAVVGRLQAVPGGDAGEDIRIGDVAAFLEQCGV